MPNPSHCVKHDTNLFVNAPVIYLFSYLHTGTAFVVIVQFRGRLVRQYRACVVDSLGLGIVCLISLYYVCVQSIPILSPLILMPSLNSTFIHLSPLIFKLIQSQFLICRSYWCKYPMMLQAAKKYHGIGSLDYSCM